MSSASSALFLAALQLQRFEAVEPHMGTLVRITAWAPDASAARHGFTRAFGRIAELDAAFSDYKPDSELNRVSREAHRAPAPISGDLFRVLSLSQQLAADTRGAFDVTAGPVVKLWREARRSREVPQVADALARCGFRKLALDAQSRTVRLAVDGMQLDLGGIAKGYAAGEALRVLRDRGLRRALVAVAGDIAVGDPPPGRSGWRVEASGRTLVLRNSAVSTSGDAEQYADIGGVRYSHIVDPRTGMALRSAPQVTVVAPSAALADAAATALSVLSEAEGRSFAARYKLRVYRTRLP